MYKFTASFKKSVMAVAKELGLQSISTERQLNNGTLMFNDPRSNVKYALYESGYIRRLLPLGNCPWGNSQTISGRGHAMYQLNKVKKVTRHGTWHGQPYTTQMNVRVMANPEEQLGILVKSVVNWRNYETR